MKAPNVIVWIVALGVLLGGCSSSQPPTDRLQRGESFPDIVLEAFDGERLPVSHYRGKFVVLNLWATWCEPCRREMPALQALAERLPADKFAVIGVSVDDDHHVAYEYLLERSITFARFFDEGGAIARSRLGISLYPYTLLIAPDGRFVQRVPGAREWNQETVVELLERAYSGDYSGLVGEPP